MGSTISTSDEQADGVPASDAPVAELRHHRASRWMHWINFPLLTIMIWSGLRIYWADVRDPYGFGIGLVGWHWFDFLPDAVNQRLGLERKLAKGMAYHFTFGWLFAINGLAYGLYTWRSGQWRTLLPDRGSAREAAKVVAHDMYLDRLPLTRRLTGGRIELSGQGRYNGAQRWSYTIIIVLGAVAVLTGLAIYKPTQLNVLTFMFGGYESARTIHFFVTIAFIVFFVVHLLQVARAGWSNFTGMVTGYERRSDLSEPSRPADIDVDAGVADSPDVRTPVPVLTADAYRARTRRSFLTGGVAVVAGALGWRHLQGRPTENRAIDVLRRGHELNERLWRGLSREQATAPTFARSASSMLRVNGRLGIRDEIDLDAWELTVLGPDGETLGTHTLDDFTALPKVELTVEHKCVEGWSHVVTWGGARFSDFMALYADRLPEGGTDFVSMATPDEGYYVGLDMPSMRNSQMLLAYELQGEPLDQSHGAPLRLATPNKYGIKCIKRIGTIQFTNEQPTDYWYERGYDWYAQL